MEFTNIGKKTLTLLLFSFTMHMANANTDLVARCDGCSDSAKLQAATTWALKSMTPAEYAMPPTTTVFKLINVIDLKADAVASYNVTIIHHSAPPRPVRPPNWVAQAVPINTPENIQIKFNDVKMAKTSLDNAINEIVIPTSVVGNAWEFMDCLYCNNVVQDFLRAETRGKIQTFSLSIESLALTLGILSAPLPSTFTIKLQDGGHIVIDITISGDKTLLVKIQQVVDADSNTVPASSAALKNQNIFISGPQSTARFNSLLNPRGFQIPQSRVGIVTIEECSWDPTRTTCK